MAQVTQEEQRLLSLTHDSLLELLGREPTKQELRQAHLGFKRMAFTLLDYCHHLSNESMIKVSHIKQRISTLLKGAKKLTKEQLLERKEKIQASFTAEELENPITKKSVEQALQNIDKLLEKAK